MRMRPLEELFVQASVYMRYQMKVIGSVTEEYSDYLAVVFLALVLILSLPKNHVDGLPD